VLMPRIGQLDGIAAGAHLQHQIGDVLEGSLGLEYTASHNVAAERQESPYSRPHFAQSRNASTFSVAWRSTSWRSLVVT
jgi:hypothetical protein